MIPRPSLPQRVALIAAIVSLAAPYPATWAVAPQAADAPDPLRSAAALVEDGRFDEALGLLEAHIEAAPIDPVAHFYRGLAFGNLGREVDAQRDFIVAANLRPGFGEAHRLASIASYRLEEYDTAWEQAILAARVGIDMSAAFAALAEVSPIPSDLERRLRASLLYVEEPDVRPLLEARSSGFEQRVTGYDSPMDGSTAPGQGEDLTTPGYIPYSVTSDSPGGGMTSAASARQDGLRKLQANVDEITEMVRRFREAIARSRDIGIASRPTGAAYRLRIEIHDVEGAMAGRLVGCELMPQGGSAFGYGDADVDTDIYEVYHPRSLRGQLVLIDVNGLEVFRDDLEMSDIASVADLHRRVGAYVDDLESWVETQG